MTTEKISTHPKQENFLEELNDLQEKYELAVGWDYSGLVLRDLGTKKESETHGHILTAPETYAGHFQTDYIYD